MDFELPVTAWHAWWARQASRDELARVASRQAFVLRYGTLTELGITRSASRWAVRCGTWTDAGRGVVAPVDIREPADPAGGQFVVARRRHTLQAAAAALRREDDGVCGRSAAIMHGLPTLTVPDSVEVVTRGPGGAGPRGAVNLRAGVLDRWQMTTWFGVDVADVARTLVDLGRYDRREAIAAADAALREDLVTEAGIERALRLAGRCPGIRAAREVLALADRRAESPLESLVRLAVHDAGLPAPELQVWIGSDRVDFWWPKYRFVLEADGRVKYTAEERWAEKTREQRIRRRDVRVERVTWFDVTAGWAETRRLLAGVLR